MKLFHWPLGTKPTQGLGVLILTGVLVSVGIVRTHNNLMYLVFSILVIFALIGWSIPALFSRSLRVKRTVPPSGHVGTEISIEVQVQNASRVFSTPMVAMEGATIPAPLAIPPTRTARPLMVAVTAASFVRRSVVRIARAAAV